MDGFYTAFKDLANIMTMLIRTNNYTLEYLKRCSNGPDEQFLKEQITRALSAAENFGLDTTYRNPVFTERGE